MRFNCVARYENCLVDVEITENRAVVSIYSRDPAQTLLYREYMKIDSPQGASSEAETSETLARKVIGHFTAAGEAGAKSVSYVGELISV